ncbi:hypothetical protein E2C01_069407 [Portunus trituberculatus]|uniref:Uncharacterized protein n=1 Tax=Portunus trituberculatus TaxID=210409 RepID=A0A5B7I2Q5_PORTR|nr:hypothetical protein [Portunus trituberculatus]
MSLGRITNSREERQEGTGLLVWTWKSRWVRQVREVRETTPTSGKGGHTMAMVTQVGSSCSSATSILKLMYETPIWSRQIKLLTWLK